MPKTIEELEEELDYLRGQIEWYKHEQEIASKGGYLTRVSRSYRMMMVLSKRADFIQDCIDRRMVEGD